jgi:hypothetical protein
MRWNNGWHDWKDARKHEVPAAHLDAGVPVHSGGWTVSPFCQSGGGVTEYGSSPSPRPAQVQRDGSDTDGQCVAVHHARPKGVDSDSVGRGPNHTDGDLSNGAEFASVHLHTDSGPLSDGRGGRVEPQGVQTMEQVFALLTVASGYLIAFAVGAWIGRPILGLLKDQIFNK